MRGQIFTFFTLSLTALACGDSSLHGLPDAPPFEDAAIDTSSTSTTAAVAGVTATPALRFRLTVARAGNGDRHGDVA
jgi:hypothetical protein